MVIYIYIYIYIYICMYLIKNTIESKKNVFIEKIVIILD